MGDFFDNVCITNPYTVSIPGDSVTCTTISSNDYKKRAYQTGMFEIVKRNKFGLYIGTKDFYIKQVLYNKPATIVFWSDGTKTVTKCVEGDEYSAETGLTICILKKLIGGAKLYNIFEDWLPDSNSNKITLSDVRKKHRD